MILIRETIMFQTKSSKTGWKPKVSLDKGIKEVIKGYSNFNSNDFDKNY